MNAVDQLHPAVRYHVVNSLGWRSLRPLQEIAVEPLTRGGSALLLAPTAGGKTEAAMLPLFSRMLTEDWRGLSVLYVCPLRALLNNLHPRLERFAELLGRRVGIWHGDTPSGARRRMMREPPDVLLTTPESLEVMLVSKHSDERRLFQTVRTLVVDEIHAFAGDDRGWHLLSVLERISRFSTHEVQRVGLSATVGNPEDLLQWLTASGEDAGTLLRPPAGDAPRPEVTLDYVGSLENAARVIARLHRGEKRLVFVDSRNRVERLATELRKLGVRTLLSHASLSKEERAQAEQAFQEGQNCVIVATSTLELGIDVGDLDRVLQIDAPPSVASMLQRMGRTGRRPGTRSNTTILATRPDALLHAAAVVRLWSEGFVEAIEPPPMPLHVFAQQIMALALQKGGIAEDEWPLWIGAMPGFAALGALPDQIIGHMVESGILWREGGILWFGSKGEDLYGRRNFMELLSVITSPPTLEVLLGRDSLGHVDESMLFLEREKDSPLLLAGRAWKIESIDWKRRVVYVQPAAEAQKGFWLGSSRPIAYEVCQAMLAVLADDAGSPHWSRRAGTAIEELRAEFPWAEEGRSFLVDEGTDRQSWWTFVGQETNRLLALAAGGSALAADDLSVAMDRSLTPEALLERLEALLEDGSVFRYPDDDQRRETKFWDSLPEELHAAMREARTRVFVPPLPMRTQHSGSAP